MSQAAQTADTNEPGGFDIQLKDPPLAAFLAWLVPGLGHAYQGRYGKAVLFFVCILGTFFYGLYIGGGRVVYASTADMLSWRFIDPQTGRWPYLCQVGVGLPALPALVQRTRELQGRSELIHDRFMRPPRSQPRPEQPPFQTKDAAGNVVRHPDELALWNYELAEYFEIGTVFTVIAGLLNILVIFDAYGGPLIYAPQGEKKNRDDDSKGEPSEAKR